MNDDWRPPSAHVLMNGSDAPLETQPASLGSRRLRRGASPAPPTSTQDLSPAERAALSTLPLPGWQADRTMIGHSRKVSYASTWRKSKAHVQALQSLQRRGVVECRTCGEDVQWRLLKPTGIALREALEDPRRT